MIQVNSIFQLKINASITVRVYEVAAGEVRFEMYNGGTFIGCNRMHPQDFPLKYIPVKYSN